MKSATPRLRLPTTVNPQTEVPLPNITGFAGLKNTDRAAREEIQHRAYSIWASAGRPNNCEMEHWLAAEAEVLAEA
ncbi:MAG TPA: DUF2934 domain-containing protein [Opitutus sp.]|nr:DUF2934 domain-containing protein [Opitutus sp.]